MMREASTCGCQDQAPRCNLWIHRLTLEPSVEGKWFLSTTVMDVFLNSGFRQRAQAVDRPKAPLPTIRTDEGVSDGMMQQEEAYKLGQHRNYV